MRELRGIENAISRLHAASAKAKKALPFGAAKHRIMAEADEFTNGKPSSFKQLRKERFMPAQERLKNLGSLQGSGMRLRGFYY